MNKDDGTSIIITMYILVFTIIRLTVLLLLLTVTLLALEVSESTGRVECARSKVDHNVTLSKGHHAGSFLKANKSITTMDKCVLQCCQMRRCDVAFFTKGSCYSIKCKDLQSCAPKANTDKRMDTFISYVAKPRLVSNNGKTDNENTLSVIKKVAKSDQILAR